MKNTRSGNNMQGIFIIFIGFMMESLSWDADDAKTIQFVVPSVSISFTKELCFWLRYIKHF